MRAWLIAGAAATLLAAPAFAQDAPRKEAGRLVDEGVALFARGDAGGALERFREAHRLYPSSKLYLNMAAALEKLGREAEAAESYDRFLTETAAEEVKAEQRKAATASLKRLEGRVGRVRVIAEGHPVSTVAVNAEPRALRAGRPLYVSPGVVVITIDVPGWRAEPWRKEIAAGTEEIARIALEEAKPEAAPPETSTAVTATTVTAGPERPVRAPSRLWTWVAAGTTAALLAGGIAMWIATDRAYDRYQDSTDGDAWDRRRDTVEERQLYTRILLGGAAAGAAVTGLLLVVGGDF